MTASKQSNYYYYYLNLQVLIILMTSIYAAMFMLAVTALSTDDHFVQLASSISDL